MNMKSICSILGIVGTYMVSTNDNMLRSIGFMLYVITNCYWISHWRIMKENIVVIQYVIYTLLAINGIRNAFGIVICI